MHHNIWQAHLPCKRSFTFAGNTPDECRRICKHPGKARRECERTTSPVSARSISAHVSSSDASVHVSSCDASRSTSAHMSSSDASAHMSSSDAPVLGWSEVVLEAPAVPASAVLEASAQPLIVPVSEAVLVAPALPASAEPLPGASARLGLGEEAVPMLEAPEKPGTATPTAHSMPGSSVMLPADDVAAHEEQNEVANAVADFLAEIRDVESKHVPLAMTNDDSALLKKKNPRTNGCTAHRHFYLFFSPI